MQIVVDLITRYKDKIFFSKDEFLDYYVQLLYKLMLELQQDGYKIDSLYGIYGYDHKINEVFTIFDAWKDLPPVELDIVESIYSKNAKYLVIFVEEKKAEFNRDDFLEQHFCHMRRVRPISVRTCYIWYEDLIKNKDQELLDTLYEEQFELMYGKEALPIKCIQGYDSVLEECFIPEYVFEDDDDEEDVEYGYYSD